MRTTLLLFLLVNMISAQTFLNGSFETNTAGSTDQINTSNAAFNSMMSDVFSFGTNANLDIIQSSAYGGSGAQHCTWYVALTEGGTDAMTLRLSSALTSGVTYTMSFWDRSAPSWFANPVSIGLSTVNNSFGTLIYTASSAPTNNVWTQRTFTFVAPNSGQYVSVIQSGTPNTTNWLHVDNFALNSTSTSGGLAISATSNTVCAGNSVTLTAAGTGHLWSPSGSLSSATSPTVTATPPVTTTYTLAAFVGACAMTSNITITVIPQSSVVLTPQNVSLCAGQTVTLTAGGASSYTWLPGSGLSTTSGSVVVASPTVSTTYTITDPAGSCVHQAVATLTVNHPLPPSVTGAVACAGRSATLSATGAVSFTWLPGQAFTPVVTVTETATTVYTVLTTDQNGCLSQGVATLQILPAPSLSVAVSASTMCRGDKRVITASGASGYTWMPGSSAGSTLQVSAQTVGNFTYTVTGSHTNGCTSIKVVSVSVKICDGVNEFDVLPVTIFPNPATGAFTIAGGMDIDISIYSATGALVREFGLKDGARRVTVEGLAPGVYYVSEKNGRLAQRIVVLE